MLPLLWQFSRFALLSDYGLNLDMPRVSFGPRRIRAFRRHYLPIVENCRLNMLCFPVACHLHALVL